MTTFNGFDLLAETTYEDGRAVELVEEGGELIQQDRDVEGRSKIRHAIQLARGAQDRHGPSNFLDDFIADAHVQVAGSFLKTDRAAEALEQLRSALPFMDAGFLADNDDPDRLRLRARAAKMLCRCMAKLDIEADILALHEQLLRPFRARAESNPGSPQHQMELIVGLFDLGETLLDRQRSALAIPPLQQVLRYFEAFAKRFPDNLSMERSIADTAVRLGDALQNLKRHEEATAMFARAAAIQEKLITAEPENPRRHHALMASLTRLSTLVRDQGHPREALADFRRCVNLAEAQVALRPEDREWRTYLYKTLDNLAHCLLRSDPLGLGQEAKETLQRALRIKKAMLFDADRSERTALRLSIVQSVQALATLDATRDWD